MTDAIRGATGRDHAGYGRLFRDYFVGDAVPAAELFTEALAPNMLVYERAGALLGYVAFHRLGTGGHINQLVVAAEARRTGIGAQLMAAAAQALRARGACDEWHLNVKQGNAAAIALYERLGMRVEHRSVAVRFAWAELDRLPVSSAPVTALAVSDGEDDDIERELGLLAGRLAMARSRGSHVCVQLRDARLAPVGVACFDPVFGGASPFRVARPALAAPLLRELVGHTRSGDLDLQLVIEDDDALAEALVAAGAAVRTRLLHYAGVLPAA